MQLNQLLQGLQYLESEIVYTCTPLGFAFQNAGEKLNGSVGALFINTSNLLKHEPIHTPKEAWCMAYKDIKEKLHFNAKDVLILDAFLSGIGQSHREEQLKQLKLVHQLLRTELQQAHEESNKFVRVYGALGISLGLILAILLF